MQNAVELRLKIDERESVESTWGAARVGPPSYLYLIASTVSLGNGLNKWLFCHLFFFLVLIFNFLLCRSDHHYSKMKKFDVAFGLIWLILLLKPETRAADYRAFLNKRGKKKYNLCLTLGNFGYII